LQVLPGAQAIYVGSRLEGTAMGRTLLSMATAAALKSADKAPFGVEIMERRRGGNRWICALNHGAEAATATVDGSFQDLPTGKVVTNTIPLQPFGVAVLSPM
jgi:beta-galactosidase GanA